MTVHLRIFVLTFAPDPFEIASTNVVCVVKPLPPSFICTDTIEPFLTMGLSDAFDPDPEIFSEGCEK